MTFVEALLLALALCVDSLVVSATAALSNKISLRRRLLMAAVFGLCQAAFPLAGAFLGEATRSFIEAVDHWIAFGLLLLVGGKMIVDGIKGEEAGKPLDASRIQVMFLLGVATSIDAFAVGIGLGLNMSLKHVLWVVTLVGVVTFVVSLVGSYLGSRKVPIPARTANIIAGAVLIGLGVKILIEHLS